MVDDAWGIVLTVDQRGSRSAPDRVTGLISALEDLPARLGFRRTAGDEAQALLLSLIHI